MGQRWQCSDKNEGYGLHEVVAMNTVAVAAVECAVVAAGVVDAGQVAADVVDTGQVAAAAAASLPPSGL